MAAKVVHALVELTQTASRAGTARGAAEPGASSGRADRAKNRNAEHQRPEDEDALEPQIRARCRTRRSRARSRPRRARTVAAPPEPALEHDRSRDDRAFARVPSPVSTTRTASPPSDGRQHLAGGVGDEIRAGQPRHAARGSRATARSQPQRSARTGTVTTMIALASANQARFVSARTSSVVDELDLPHEVRDGRGGQDERPDLPRSTRHPPVRPPSSRGDGTSACSAASARRKA